jgi:hypothetical protein
LPDLTIQQNQNTQQNIQRTYPPPSPKSQHASREYSRSRNLGEVNPNVVDTDDETNTK